MTNLLNLYRTQVRILWNWRGGWWALTKRIIITLLVATVAFMATAYILPGIAVVRVLDAVIAVSLMGLFNVLVRPLLLSIVAPRSLVLTGILVIVLQVLVFLVVAPIAPGVAGRYVPVRVDRFVHLCRDQHDAHGDPRRGSGRFVLRLARARTCCRRAPPRRPISRAWSSSRSTASRTRSSPDASEQAPSTRSPAGSAAAATSSRRWEAILPSMTSASQAGILHGNNDGIPAFRWYERDRKKLMVSSSPVDAAEIVRRVSNGEGLLSNNGVSICNLVTGDATRAYVTTAAIKDEAQGIGDSKAFLGFFLSPSGYLRSFTLFLGEFIKERYQARRTRRSGVTPQMHRGMKYAGMRAASNVLLRDVNVSLIIEEMYRGANVIYADFTDYDELAHHCGPERVESLQALDGVDEAIGTLAKAAEDAPRPYKFIVLSDHGQSLGLTFKQRYGQSLGEVVRDLMSGRATVMQTTTKAEGSTFVNSFLSEITRSQGVGPTVARAALAGKTHDGVVDLDDEELPPPADESTIAVVGSGNLGLVWFTGNDHRLTVEELEELHPGLVARLAAHPGVGLLMVRSSKRGAVAFGPAGVHYLDEEPRRRGGPDDDLRTAHRHEPPARGRDDPCAGSPPAQHVRPGHGRGGGVRGADRVARWPRWPADPAVHPPPGRVDARRGGAAGRAGDLPQHPALARVDRHPARQGARGRPAVEAAAAEPSPRPDDRRRPDQAAKPPPIVRRAPGRVPVGRAWNNFIVHPASVRRAIRVIIAAYVTAMLLGGLVIWLVDPHDYPDIWLAFWYVLQTITTVGYGDATPTDPVGRAVGAVIMLVSIATLSILTAFITSAFVEARQAERRAQSDADEAAQRAHLEARLSDLVERLERIEQQGRRPS